VVFVLAFALTLVGAVLVGIVGALFGASFDDPPAGVTIAATVLQDAAFVGAALLLALRAGPLRAAQFGLRRTPLWAALGWMALAYVGYLVLSGLWSLAVDLSEQQDLPQELGADQSTAALVAVCVLVTVLAPLAEEFFFRGYVFGALRNWHGPWLAAAITGVVFGAVHVASAPVGFLLPLAIFGFFLCIVRWRTGSLLPCMVLHALNNAVAFGVTQDWTAVETLLLALGASSVVLLACLPFLRVQGRAARALI
ncbi:MAG: type II CAAX endopeptidase family protein, partial [Conexibacter sp.]